MHGRKVTTNDRAVMKAIIGRSITQGLMMGYPCSLAACPVCKLGLNEILVHDFTVCEGRKTRLQKERGDSVLAAFALSLLFSEQNKLFMKT